MSIEKGPLLPSSAPPDPPQRQRTSFLSILSFSLIASFLLFSSRSESLVPPSHDHHALPVNGVNSAGLKWAVCPDTPKNESYIYYCSLFSVPTNWLEPVEGETTEVFMRMLKADKGKKMGTMLINPGGPGGSGNRFLYGRGPSLNVLTQGRFDIIGFDPRGINLTSSPLGSFSSPEELFQFTKSNIPVPPHDFSQPLNMSDPKEHAIDTRYISSLDSFNDLKVALTIDRTSEAARKSVSTAFVSRDMAAIVDALGENNGELIYWGFSYGTILGATFAAMFPEKAGRMVLDGVSHAGDYTAGMHEWGMSSMEDSSKTLSEFYHLCVTVGPERCALSPSLSSISPESPLSISERASIIEHKMLDLLHELHLRPLPVKDGKNGPMIVTAVLLHAHMFTTLYSPAGWAGAARAYAGLLSGNGTDFANLLPAPSLTPHKNETDNAFNRSMNADDMSQVGILCGDSEPAGKDLEDWVSFGEKLRSRSFTGEEWRFIMSPCRSWNSRPYERYTGPWTVEDGLRKTKSPILWVGNEWDPVTPLKSARRMADGFGNSSALLTHVGRGHCSIAEPSLCSIKAIQDFFINGTVPEKGKTCYAEPGFTFPSPSNGTFSVASQANEHDRELLEAAEALKIDWMMAGSL